MAHTWQVLSSVVTRQDGSVCGMMRVGRYDVSPVGEHVTPTIGILGLNACVAAVVADVTAVVSLKPHTETSLAMVQAGRRDLALPNVRTIRALVLPGGCRCSERRRTRPRSSCRGEPGRATCRHRRRRVPSCPRRSYGTDRADARDRDRVVDHHRVARNMYTLLRTDILAIANSSILGRAWVAGAAQVVLADDRLPAERVGDGDDAAVAVAQGDEREEQQEGRQRPAGWGGHGDLIRRLRAPAKERQGSGAVGGSFCRDMPEPWR